MIPVLVTDNSTVGDSRGPEAGCSCQLFRARLQLKVITEAMAVFCAEEASGMAGGANTIIVVCTQGLMHGTDLAEMIMGMDGV